MHPYQPDSIAALLTLVHALVRAPDLSLAAKRDAVLANASKAEKVSLYEFASWFDVWPQQRGHL